MSIWNWWGSVPPTRLRTTALNCLLSSKIRVCDVQMSRLARGQMHVDDVKPRTYRWVTEVHQVWSWMSEVLPCSSRVTSNVSPTLVTAWSVTGHGLCGGQRNISNMQGSRSRGPGLGDAVVSWKLGYQSLQKSSTVVWKESTLELLKSYWRSWELPNIQYVTPVFNRVGF